MIALCLLLLAAPTREELARQFAPIIYQEAHDPLKDLFAAFDFDGDWSGDDQAENLACWSDPSKCSSQCTGHRCPLVATVYFTVIETPTHWFIQYMPYHPLDWKVTNGHENDTESMLLVVSKAGPAVQALETRFHLSWYQYSADPLVQNGADDVDGPVHFESDRPAVYSQMVGHGLCGGFSPPNFSFPDLSLTCNHGEVPHLERDGVRYSPLLPAAMPVVGAGVVQAGYRLAELRDAIWPHIHEIGPGKAFQSAIDFAGERCAQFACPRQFGGAWEGDEGDSPGEPWAQEGGKGVTAVGDQFFDPAYTMSKRLTFPQPYSLEYCFNPYLGIADTCSPAAPDAGALDAGPDAGSDAGSLLPPDSGMPPDAGSHVPILDASGCASAPGALWGLLALLAALCSRRRTAAHIGD